MILDQADLTGKQVKEKTLANIRWKFTFILKIVLHPFQAIP